MKAIVHVRKEGPWFVAMDLVTTVSGQGATEKEAIAVLLEGLRERYGGLKILMKKQKGTKIVDLKGIRL